MLAILEQIKGAVPSRDEGYRSMSSASQTPKVTPDLSELVSQPADMSKLTTNELLNKRLRNYRLE